MHRFESINATISNSRFISGIAEDVLRYDILTSNHNIQAISGGGGLAVYSRQWVRDGPVIVTIINSIFYNNSAQYGGNMILFMQVGSEWITVSVMNCPFLEGTAYLKGVDFIHM